MYSRRNEETLTKLPSGIGRVFLDTIRQTESIRRCKVQQVDPRSAARTPAANKVPKYRLRYDSPVWASPSRDTFHGRWEQEKTWRMWDCPHLPWAILPSLTLCHPQAVGLRGGPLPAGGPHLQRLRQWLCQRPPASLQVDLQPRQVRPLPPLHPSQARLHSPLHTPEHPQRVRSDSVRAVSQHQREEGSVLGRSPKRFYGKTYKIPPKSAECHCWI